MKDYRITKKRTSWGLTYVSIRTNVGENFNTKLIEERYTQNYERACYFVDYNKSFKVYCL